MFIPHGKIFIPYGKFFLGRYAVHGLVDDTAELRPVSAAAKGKNVLLKICGCGYGQFDQALLKRQEIMKDQAELMGYFTGELDRVRTDYDYFLQLDSCRVTPDPAHPTLFIFLN